MHPKPLSNYLRTHRKRAALSQDEMAFLLGSKCGSRISRYERSKQVPSLRTLLSYELLFQTPVRDLYGGTLNEVRENLRKRAKLLIAKLRATRPGLRTRQKLEALYAIASEQKTQWNSAA